MFFWWSQKPKKGRQVLKDVFPESEKEILLPNMELISRKEFQRRQPTLTGDLNVAIQFSCPWDATMDVARGWADRQMFFAEYSIPSDGWIGEIKANVDLQRMLTGPEYTGMYIAEAKPEPLRGREEMWQRLMAVKEKNVAAATRTEGAKRLAYSYATHNYNTEKYVKFVYDAARSQYAGDTIQLVVYDANRKNLPRYTTDKPDNVELVVLHRRPLSLGFLLEAHADLPMLLTGDFGPTLAVDYEKPFFMETHSHKRYFKKALLQRLKETMSPENFKLAQQAMDFTLMTEINAAEFTNPNLWKEFAAGMASFRGQNSLTLNIIDQVELESHFNSCVR